MFVNKKKKSPPKYYIWVFLGVICLGLGLYIYQSATVGLPENAKDAGEKILANMESLSSVHVSAEHELSNSFLGDYRLVVKEESNYLLTNDVEGEVMLEGDQEILEANPIPQPLLFTYINDKNYTKEGDNDWVDHSENQEFIPFDNVDPLSLLEFSLENGEIAREADEEIDGQAYAVFSFSYQEEKTQEVLKPFSLLLSEVPEKATVEARIWVEQTDGLIKKQQAIVNVPEIGGEVVTTTFSEYNAITYLEIPSEVTKASPITEKEKAIREEELELEEKNERRQIDLLAIRAALEQIYEDNNTYPESPDSISLEDENSEVHKELIKYLKQVPFDPDSPKYYYGYQCAGGEQYELTGIQVIDGEETVISLTQSSSFFEEK